MLYVVMVWWLIFRAMTWFIPWNVFPFIPDVDMIMAGENRGGLYIGFQQFARKITAGLSAMAWGLVPRCQRFRRRGVQGRRQEG